MTEELLAEQITEYVVVLLPGAVVLAAIGALGYWIRRKENSRK